MGGLVLIAEGDPFDLRLLEELCREAGFDVVTAGDGSTALTVIARQRPSLIVLDAELTTDDGAGVLEILAADPSLCRVPVLLTTRANDEERRKRGVELGAADFVTRPYRVFEVEKRVSNLLRLAAAERAVESARGSVVTDPGAGTDPLTHAGGAAQLRIMLEYEATRAVRYGHFLCCIVLRVENFGDVLARSEDAAHGLLVQLATHVRGAIRGIDHLFRSDTDELTILLPETEGGATVVERLRRAASSGQLAAAIEPAPVLTVGVASIVPGGAITDGEALRQAARDALAPIAMR